MYLFVDKDCHEKQFPSLTVYMQIFARIGELLRKYGFVGN